MKRQTLILAVLVLVVTLLTLGLLAGMASAAGGDVLSGKVVDADGPVADAVVRVYNSENQTTSDAKGAFRLNLGTKLNGSQAITVTAWSPGFYIGWITTTLATKPVTITMKPHFTGDNPKYDWFKFEGVSGSASCGLCHTQNPEWEADAHSKSAVNPRFLTLYTGADVKGRKGPLTKFTTDGKAIPPAPGEPDYGPGLKLDYPTRAGNCATCHTPLASKIPNTQNCGWSGCHTSQTSEWSQGVVPPGPTPLDLKGDALEGITCDFCHKIGEVALDPKTGLPPPDMPGILSYRLYRPQEGQQLFFGTFDDIPRRDTYLPLLEESAFCAPCHYGVMGGVVGAGHVTGGTTIYNSYGEWLESPYSNPKTGKTCQECHMPPVEYDHIVFPERGGVKRPSDRIHNHRMAGAADEKLLQNSVTMTTTANLNPAGRQVAVDVNITNDKTGHHIPTDAPMRQMILVVQAADEAGRPLKLLSGPSLPDWTGNYSGQPGKAYAKILRDEWTGETPTAAFWRPVTIVADTRLPALATDRSRYTFELPPGSRAAKVEARLIFRRAFQKLADQKGWTDPDILMEEATVPVK